MRSGRGGGLSLVTLYNTGAIVSASGARVCY